MSVNVYDISGRLVKKLHNGVVNDRCIIDWNGKGDSGNTVPQGVYFIRFENLDTDETIVQKVLKIE